ncbi:metallopeptidase family protein [Sphingomonas sanguinis]|jgi:predicted Zn-dependent protease with MMP-like domain|uniref:Metallopeptidase family protein n=1 Tax=Sphingomonas sanguinis TaxID=33051 RepID=A0A7Y7UQG2_9SPHN|nr:metallopeptidase family protein [Sphingomonas sanguinis]MBZ6381613.1 metallopeptidase family protein [Sphingomonas sanguinis]NNG48137.1 metallopeptidase family protein [Sphingomonas sanguinis]NNG53839.1 metallopeptidase family protein [Sphingomonas sanguinis]NVP30914.1 metallopeptidase family protein [Sphingomonas sanguinis]
MSGQDAIGEAPGPEVIERIARDAIARLPEEFRAHLGDVVLIVEEFADDETLAALGLEHPLDLTGLYHGRPVGEKSSMDSASLPDRIHLYRRAILDEWIETGVRLDDLVVHVTIHEIGHHFGLSDDDMHALEDAVT